MKIERKRGNHSVSNALPSRSGVDKLHAGLEDARASKRWSRALPVSRVRRELASIIRRRECILIERQGEAVARLVPVVTIEEMDAAILLRGASAGVLAGAPVDFAAVHYNTPTSIQLVRRGNLANFGSDLNALLANPRLHRKCVLACSFLSRAEVAGEFAKIMAGVPVRGHVVQLMWILSSFVHAVREAQSVPVVYCKP